MTPTPTPTPTSTAQAQTITFSAPTSMTVGGADQVLIATASSGLAISYSTGTPTICSIITGSVRALAAGTCSITASQAGNATYAPAESVTQSFTISSAPTGGGGGGPALKKPVFILFSNVLTLSRLEIPEMFYARSSGGTVASYSISPALPVGMTFATRTASVGGASLVNLGATTYTITATNAAGTANATFDLTINGIPCDGSFTCAVGDTGPGGGLVFYHSVAGFSCGETLSSTCHYLEVAPNGWNTVSDPVKLWAVIGQKTNDVSGIENDLSAANSDTRIGLGLKNSIAIVLQGNDTTTAAGVARAYLGGGMSDWYLPATAELNLLCQWNRGVVQDVTISCTGGTLNSATFGASSAGFVNSVYWSSSEGVLFTVIKAWRQSFIGGNQSPTAKESSYYVRPIRAF